MYKKVTMVYEGSEQTQSYPYFLQEWGKVTT